MQEIITSTIDLEDIRSYRNHIKSRCQAAAGSPSYQRIVVDFALTPEHDTILPTAVPIEVVYLTPEEEIANVKTIKLILCVLFYVISILRVQHAGCGIICVVPVRVDSFYHSVVELIPLVLHY